LYLLISLNCFASILEYIRSWNDSFVIPISLNKFKRLTDAIHTERLI
jgi:hypothetical protein